MRTCTVLRLGWGEIVASERCEVINVKVGRVGGYSQTPAIHDLCYARRVPVWCGGMLESGIGRAHNIALASLPGFVLPGDISASSRYFARDVVSPPVRVDSSGSIELSSSAGLGYGEDIDFIVEHTHENVVVRREAQHP